MFYCKPCNKLFDRKPDFERHKISKKCITNTNPIEKKIQFVNQSSKDCYYECNQCEKKYKKKGLNHMKKNVLINSN